MNNSPDVKDGEEYDVKDTAGLKEAGNRAFAEGDLEQAYTLYSGALEGCGGDPATKSADFRCTVLTNRAMVLFKQGKAEACVADCSIALELDPGRVKAYFRRALAKELLGDDADALRDAKRALELNPGNKDAIKAARRIKDKVARAAAENSPIRQALTALREVATKAQELGEEPGSASSKEDDDYSQVLLGLGALLSRESSAAVRLLREGGMVPLLACMKTAGPLPKTAKEALRALGAAAQHKSFGIVLMKTQGAAVLTELTTILEAEKTRTPDASPGAVHRDVGVAEGALSAGVHLLQWDEKVVTDSLEECPDVSRDQVEKAGKDLADAAVKLLVNGLRLPKREIFDLSLEATVRWCAPGCESESSDKPQGSEDASLPAKQAYQKRQISHRRRLRGSLWLRDKGLGLLCSPALVSLYKALSSEEPVVRRKTSACLSRIARAVTSVQANEKEREADSGRIKDAVKPLLGFQPEAGGSTVQDAKAEGEALAAISTESRMQGTIRRVATTTALANAEGALGSWAMGLPGFLAEAMTLAASGDDVAQEAAAESFCSAASFDGGRGLLGPVVESGIIFALMESRSQAARSAAASAYAKLGMISSALASDSDDVTKLLNVSLDLIASNKPKNTPNGSSLVRASTLTPFEAARGMGASASMDSVKDGKAIADSERAVEVLSFLVSKTKVKEELCYGSVRCPKAFPRLCQAAQNIDGTSPIAYGLAFLFSSLCVSKEEETKESFRGKDMTYDQFLQLKQLHDAHGQGAKEDNTDTKDTHDAARRRSHALVEAGCVFALKKVAEGASPATKERIALCFRRLATEPLNRGLIVQQGGLALLMNMASVLKQGNGQGREMEEYKDMGKGCLSEARHAIAKTLVTTNPNLLTEAQTMGCVPPLIAMCKDHESLNLQQFEGLMALTNLASLENVRSRIIAEKGISCFHFLQFSDHEMVRRAATEAMCNLLPHPKMMEHMRSSETLKLWAAFAKLGLEDPPTAAAAIGGLAMAVMDPEVAKVFMAEDVTGCEALVCALLSEAPDIPNAADLILRAAVATKHIAEVPFLRPLLLLGGVADALTEALEVVKIADGTGNARATEACSSALEILKQKTAASAQQEGVLLPPPPN
ncbi:unnamed protein product [Ascophyllum nodosum]